MLPACNMLARRAPRPPFRIVVDVISYIGCDGDRKQVSTRAEITHYFNGAASAGFIAGRRRNRAVGRPAVADYCSVARGGAAKKVVPFLLADIGEGISEVTVKEWHVKVGDRVAEFDDVCEVESDKANVTITSRYAGVVTAIHHEVGSTARVGSALVDIEVDVDASEAAVETTAATAAAGAGAQEEEEEKRVQAVAGGDSTGADDNVAGKVLTTPAVRRIAAEKGIDLTTVRGTGKQGRVLKEDLLEWEPSGSSAAALSPPPPPPPPPPTPADFIPLIGYEKTMRNTVEASNKIPTLMITDEVKMTRLTELKARLSQFERLTFLPFLIKATSLALARHPRMNCTASPDYTSYRLNASHNIGVAIDTPLGLAVANVKDVQTLAVIDVARQLAELRDKAAQGRLTLADITGGTFTLSNIGSIAGSAFQPMILPTEVAIGALGRVQYRPRYDDQDQLVRTPVMGVSWAADHRILDGATVAKFFKDWKTYVENPELILAGIQLQPSEK